MGLRSGAAFAADLAPVAPAACLDVERALHIAATLEIDAAIDPAGLRLAGARVRERTVGFIDPC